MATHFSVPAWRIPGTGEPGGLPSMESQSQTRLKRLSSSSSTYISHSVNACCSVVVQFFSWDQLFATQCTVACQASLSTISWSLLKLPSIDSVMPSNHLILCHPLLLLPSIFPSIRVLCGYIYVVLYFAKVFDINLCNSWCI